MSPESQLILDKILDNRTSDITEVQFILACKEFDEATLRILALKTYNSPVNEVITKTDNYKLTEPYIRFSEYDNKILGFYIEKGYINDGASVPPIAWSVASLPFLKIEKDGRCRGGALIHDFTYRNGGILTSLFVYDLKIKRCLNFCETFNFVLTKKDADNIIQLLFKKDGVTKLGSWLTKMMVKAFGKSSWKGK